MAGQYVRNTESKALSYIAQGDNVTSSSDSHLNAATTADFVMLSIVENGFSKIFTCSETLDGF